MDFKIGKKSEDNFKIEGNIFCYSVKVEKKMSVHRSFRRGATTRAKEAKVDQTIVDLNNRWRKVQEKKGALPSLPMSQLYLEISQALGSKLAFSRIL